MEQKTAKIAIRICIIGTVLILLNNFAIAILGSPFIVSPYPVSSVDLLLKEGGPLWFRIVFGVSSMVTWPWIMMWLIVSFINFALSIFIYLKQKLLILNGFLILILSIFSFFSGGGFIIGSFLAILGGCMLIQWKKPSEETFIGKLINVAKLNSKIFLLIKQNERMLREAVIALTLINFISGLGVSIYLLNVNKILNETQMFAAGTLLQGEIFFDFSVFGLPLLYIGLSILKWLILSSIMYIYGSRLMGINVEFDAVARVTAFAYAPVSFQFFMPFVFLNQPYLTVHWPLFVVFVTNLWMIFALIVAIKVLFDIPTTKAVGVVLLVGSIYWLLTYQVILPSLFPTSIPGITFEVHPIETLLTFFSLSMVLSIILGAFSKH